MHTPNKRQVDWLLLNQSEYTIGRCLNIQLDEDFYLQNNGLIEHLSTI